MYNQPQYLEETEEEYEPTEEEILEYAKFLGMNLDEDRDLLYIAEEGLKAPVPEPWKALQNDDDEIFYFNLQTGTKSVDHPLDEVYKKKYQEEKRKKQMRKMQQEGVGGGPQFGTSSIRGVQMGQPVMDISNASFLAQQNKFDDPVIKAEAEKRLKEQRKALQEEYEGWISEIDKNFELRKQEIINQNKKEIEAEKQKWELFKKEEERRVRQELESEIENQIISFKDKLAQEEEKEKLQIQRETDQQLRKVEKEMEEKLEKEKKALIESYAKIRKSVEDAEKERYEFEIEKFKKDQSRALDSKKVDIDKLKNEKRKVQNEYNEQLEKLRSEMEAKIERERKIQQENFKNEVQQIEKEEEEKYERKLDQMRKDLQNQSAQLNMDFEIQEYKEKLEEEFEQAIRDYKSEQEHLLEQEEERLEKQRQKEIREYEQILSQQYENDLKRKQQKLQITRENEEREFELVKLRIDQMYQDQIESFRKQCQQKYEKERRLFEEEKRKRLVDIQHSIEKLNISSSDKEKLKQEIQTLQREQKELQQKIDELEREQEEEKGKKRQLEREINELNIQLNSQKLSTGASKEDTQRIQWLRDEIAKKKAEISTAQRQYKDLIDSKFDDMDKIGTQHKPSQNDSQNIKKLESEMRQIKQMISEFGMNQAKQSRLSDLVGEIEELDNKENSSIEGNDESLEHLRDYVQKEKSEIKELQTKLEQEKRKFKEDKREVENLKISDPQLYRQKMNILEKVQASIEGKIDKVNDRIAKVKQAERKLK